MVTQSEIKNKLILGDNLEVLKTLKDESVDLIYIDPPFFSNKNYEVVFGDEAEVRSFEDRWEGGVNVYVEWMRERVRELHRVLKPTGSFYLHCDWHASHHLRVMLDEVFGAKHFQNEIIWFYETGGISKVRFGRKHDNIYFYTKTNEYTFNANEVLEKRSEEVLRRLATGMESATRARGEQRLPSDVWRIPAINAMAKERVGYPTQKPEALLEKIIKASSNKDDVVLDAFCGCGTTVAVAQRLGRKWTGIDISPTAIKVIKDRFKKGLGGTGQRVAMLTEGIDYIVIGMPTTIEEVKKLKPFEFQNWVINEMGAKHRKKKVGDMGLDGYFDKDLWHDEAGVQVKQSEGVGRNVVDNFETALKRARYKKGYIVAFSFGKGAYEEAARVKKEGLDMKLIKISELLNKKEPIL